MSGVYPHPPGGDPWIGKICFQGFLDGARSTELPGIRQPAAAGLQRHKINNLASETPELRGF